MGRTQKLKGLAAASLRLKTFNDNPYYKFSSAIIINSSVVCISPRQTARIYDCCTISKRIIDMTGGSLKRKGCCCLRQIGEIWPMRVPKFEKVVDEFC